MAFPLGTAAVKYLDVSSLSSRDFCSPQEFVKASGLSISTVRRYLDDDLLPKLQLGGRRSRVLVDLCELRARLAADAHQRRRNADHSRHIGIAFVNHKDRRGSRARWRKKGRTLDGKKTEE